MVGAGCEKNGPPREAACFLRFFGLTNYQKINKYKQKYRENISISKFSMKIFSRYILKEL